MCQVKEVREFGGREAHTTNNRMEIRAAIEALTPLAFGTEATVYSDSSYVINGITKWVEAWKKRGWITSQKDEVQNRDLWEKLMDVVKAKRITWECVGGHVGIVGNERCDEIATGFADDDDVTLYRGSLAGYGIKNILDTSANVGAQKEKSASKSRVSGKAYSYLSLLGGVLEKHATWAECEERVKGKSGVKFRKALSKEDEEKIIVEWMKK